MAVFNEPTKWQTSLVNSGDANVIPQSTPVGTGKASFKDGFPQITQIPLSAGGQAPDRKDFNGLFKILGDWIFFNQNGGVSTYSESFDYVAGRVVLYTDGNLYKCIQANGVSSTVVTPDSGTEYWQRLDNFVRSVNGINADAQGNVNLDISTNIPDYANGIDITSVLQSSPYTYTVPANGVIQFYCQHNTGWRVSLNNSTSTEEYGKNTLMHLNNESGIGTSSYLIVEKGFVVRCPTEHDAQFAMFYPFK